jgi:hypothetical protein
VREAGTASKLPSVREQVEELIELQLQLQREARGIPRPSVPALAAVDAIIASGFRGGMAPPLDSATSARDGATSARDGAPARLESAAAAQAAVRALAIAVQAMGDAPSGTSADACACSVGSSSHASASSAPLEAIAAAAATAAAADASAPVPPGARYDASPSAPVPPVLLAAPTTALAPMDGVATVAEGLRRMIAPWHGVGRDHEGESLISSANLAADLAAGATPLKLVIEAPTTALPTTALPTTAPPTTPATPSEPPTSLETLAPTPTAAPALSATAVAAHPEAAAAGALNPPPVYTYGGAPLPRSGRYGGGGGSYGDESGPAAPVVDDDELPGLDASGADLKLAPLVASAASSNLTSLGRRPRRRRRWSGSSRQ